MGGMWLWWVLLLFVVGAVVWFAAYAGRRGSRPREDSPEEVLKRRYAKGEVDRDTYDRMLTDLRR